MKLLVTGGNGFIGGYLCGELLGQGVSVRISSRNGIFCNGKMEIAFTGQIDGLTDWGSSLDDVDAIVHLAAKAHVSNAENAGALGDFRRVNVDGTLNLARQAVLAGVRRFIFISSIGVNGNVSDRAFTERDNPNPQGPYAISKFEAEQGLLEIANHSKMEVVIIRPPLVYAVNAPGNFAKLMTLIKWAARLHLPLPFGAINNRRSLVSVENLVDFIILCIGHPFAANQVFLVADGMDVSTTELFSACARSQKVDLRLLPVPQRWLESVAKRLGKQGLILKMCGNLQIDINKARSLLGWSPVVPSFMAGITEHRQDLS